MTDQRPVARLFQVPNKDGEFCGEKMELVHQFLHTDGLRSSGKVDQHGSTTVVYMAVVGDDSHLGFVISLVYQRCVYLLLTVGHIFGQ